MIAQRPEVVGFEIAQAIEFGTVFEFIMRELWHGQRRSRGRAAALTPCQRFVALMQFPELLSVHESDRARWMEDRGWGPVVAQRAFCDFLEQLIEIAGAVEAVKPSRRTLRAWFGISDDDPVEVRSEVEWYVFGVFTGVAILPSASRGEVKWILAELLRKLRVITPSSLTSSP